MTKNMNMLVLKPVSITSYNNNRTVAEVLMRAIKGDIESGQCVVTKSKFEALRRNFRTFDRDTDDTVAQFVFEVMGADSLMINITVVSNMQLSVKVIDCGSITEDSSMGTLEDLHDVLHDNRRVNEVIHRKPRALDFIRRTATRTSVLLG